MNYNPYPYSQNYSSGDPRLSYSSASSPYPQPYAQPQTPSAVCRPVTSKEEAVGVPVDFMGSLMVFPDMGHGKVYVKRFNSQTGSADFMEFAYVGEKKEADTFSILNAKIDELANKIDMLVKGGEDAKSVGNGD